MAQQADDRLQQGGFADTIEADQAGHLARRNREIDIAQDMTLAVVDVEITNGEQMAVFATGGMGILQGHGAGHGISWWDPLSLATAEVATAEVAPAVTSSSSTPR